MPSVRWSARALRDVQRLHRLKNPDAARRAVRAIQQGVQVLTRQPGIGRPIEDLPEEFREWLIDFGASGYVVRYRLDGEDVVLLAVWHQKEAGL